MSKLLSIKMPAEPGFSIKQTKLALIYSGCFLKFKHHDTLPGHQDKGARNHVTWHLGLAEPWISTTSVFNVWYRQPPFSNYRHVKDLKKESPVMLVLHIELIIITLCSLVEVRKCSSGACYCQYHCTWSRHTFFCNTGTLLLDYIMLCIKTAAITISGVMMNSKLIQITMTIYVREVQDLFVNIQLETVICNWPEVNRSNLQEKQPRVDEVSEDSILALNLLAPTTVGTRINP